MGWVCHVKQYNSPPSWTSIILCGPATTSSPFYPCSLDFPSFLYCLVHLFVPCLLFHQFLQEDSVGQLGLEDQPHLLYLSHPCSLGSLGSQHFPSLLCHLVLPLFLSHQYDLLVLVLSGPGSPPGLSVHFM